MLCLGLRATEVATLQLRRHRLAAGLLTVHGKDSRVDRLPLPVDVWVAITGYLQRGRPRTAVREVFVRLVAPRVALHPGGMTGIVLSASRRAGLGPVRAHRLRHTAACQMLRAGVSPAQIGQVLRHRSAGSTAAYARVDVERLGCPGPTSTSPTMIGIRHAKFDRIRLVPLHPSVTAALAGYAATRVGCVRRRETGRFFLSTPVGRGAKRWSTSSGKSPPPGAAN